MSEDSDFSEQDETRQIQDLEDKISVLERENKSLKQQFSQAVKLTENFKQQLQKNDELTNQVRQLQHENSDLQNRIQILKKADEEISEKNATERQRIFQQREEETERSKQENEHIRTVLTEQITQLQSQIDESERENSALECELKKIKENQQKCINSASYYFQEEIDNLSQIISLFEGNTQEEKSPSSTPVKGSVTSQTHEENDKQIEKKYKTTLKKLKAAKDKIYKLEEQLAAANHDAKEATNKQATIVRQYEAKLKQTAEESQLKVEDQEHQISLLTNKVENLKSSIQKSRSQMNTTQTLLQTSPMGSPIKEVESPKKCSMNVSRNESQSMSRKSIREEKKERDDELDQMVAANTDLTLKLRAAEERKSSLSDQLMQAHQERKELEVNAEKQKHSLNVLSAVHKETIAELETLRNALSTLSPVKEHADQEQQKKKKESANLRAKISKLENTIEKQKEEISAADEEASNAKSEITQLTIKANKLEEDLKNSEDQIKNLNDAVQAAETKYQNKPTVTEEDLIPESAWRYSGFDQELYAQINKISQNSSLQVSSKLQTAFKTIKQYYDNIIASSDDDADSAERELSEFRSIVDKFVVDVSIASTGEPVSLDEFVEDEGSSIVENVSQLKHSFDDLSRRYRSVMGIVQQYQSTFMNDNETDISASIANVKQAMDKSKADLDNRNKRVKELKSVLDKYQKKVIAEKKQLTEDNENLKNDNDELRADNDTLTDEVSSLKRRNQELTQLVRETREENEQLESTMIENQDEAAQNAAAEMTRLDESHREELKEREEIISQTEEELDEATAEIRKLKGVILSQRKAMDEFKSKTNEEKESYEATIAENANNYEEEKKHIIDTYEAALSEIKEQNEKRRQDIEKLSQDIEKCDSVNKDTKKKLSQVKREKRNLEEDLRIAKENFERENKLRESQSITKIMELDADYTTRSNKQSEQFEKERLNIFTFAANEFKNIVTPLDTINESTYKSLISRVHTEYDRLHSSDVAIRRITNAAEKQTTEDAVMQILM